MNVSEGTGSYCNEDGNFLFLVEGHLLLCKYFCLFVCLRLFFFISESTLNEELFFVFRKLLLLEVKILSRFSKSFYCAVDIFFFFDENKNKKNENEGIFWFVGNKNLFDT